MARGRREIAARHEAGQPVLVGTISVEVSELLSDAARASAASRTRCSTPSPSTPSARARSSPRPAGPARSRSRPTWPAAASTSSSAATPSTCTELELAKLGLKPGDPDYDERFAEILPAIEERVEEDREKVVEAGGLFICGTERHESRRIDNQLRGRSGRQGDPGESRFFLSAEDDLVRLFAGDRIYNILDRLGEADEDGNEQPIEAGMLSKQIEKAQRKVEEQNFLIRKRVLEYDDVMNEQRGSSTRTATRCSRAATWASTAREEIGEVIARLVDEYTPGDYIEDGTSTGCSSRSTTSSRSDFGPDEIDPRRSTARSSSSGSPRTPTLYDDREEELGDELMRALERYLLLQIIDQRWREHLYDMDYLREGIHLRGFAQIEPIVAYKNEAFTLFTDLMSTIWSDFARMVFNVEVEVEGENGDGARAAAAQRRAAAARAAASRTRAAPRTPSRRAAAAARPRHARSDEPAPAVEQRRVDEHEQIGRNDPCWCGSGKKYKKCHGA